MKMLTGVSTCQCDILYCVFGKRALLHM